MPLIRMTREQLHNLVWSKALRDAAIEIGVSDVGLKKICSRYGIPTPPQGYWLRVGPRDPAKVPAVLPTLASQVIDIHALDPASPLAKAEEARRDLLLDRESKPEFAISVEAPPGSLHPMIRRVQSILSAAKPDDYGCLRCYETDLPFARVSPSSVPRALALLNAIVLVLEARGFKWKVGSGSRWDSSASIVIEDVPFQIGVYETVQRRVHRLTPDEQARLKKTGWSSAPAYDFIPSGLISIRQDQYDDFLKDGRQGRVEERLNDLMTILIERAFAAREGRRQAEMEERLRSECAAHQAKIRQLAELRQAAEKALIADAAAWSRSQQLRAYVRAVEQHEALRDHPKRLRWLAWAREQADALDPLARYDGKAIDVDFQSFDELADLLEAPELDE